MSLNNVTAAQCRHPPDPAVLPTIHLFAYPADLQFTIGLNIVSPQDPRFQNTRHQVSPVTDTGPISLGHPLEVWSQEVVSLRNKFTEFIPRFVA